MKLSQHNTAVVLDSTADFPDAQIRFPNTRVVPLYVRFGEESFRDYVELDPHGFYERLRTATELPTTSQPTPQDFLSTYNALSGYDRVYSVHISSRLSGTLQSASLAAAEAGGDRVRLIDSESASVGIAMLAIAIQELLARGTTDEEIEGLAERHRMSAGLLFT
ncbi:MAG: DegV family EDD domain-containing protein, partial [Actinobacteria bacterium]|nr:DegV family EDD domain-containing protein [Actinomycetota bacterium]